MISCYRSSIFFAYSFFCYFKWHIIFPNNDKEKKKSTKINTQTIVAGVFAKWKMNIERSFVPFWGQIFVAYVCILNGFVTVSDRIKSNCLNEFSALVLVKRLCVAFKFRFSSMKLNHKVNAGPLICIWYWFYVFFLYLNLNSSIYDYCQFVKQIFVAFRHRSPMKCPLNLIEAFWTSASVTVTTTTAACSDQVSTIMMKQLKIESSIFLSIRLNCIERLDTMKKYVFFCMKLYQKIKMQWETT